MGGSLRIQMEVRALKDPRTYDWSQMANITRGFLEYLVSTTARRLLLGCPAGKLGSQRRRLPVYAARASGRDLEQRGRLHRRGRGRELHRLVRLDGGRQLHGGPHGRAVDPDTGVAREGAIEVIDDMTVQITYPSSDITLSPASRTIPPRSSTAT
jgi:peptide/nickel transport system substrate-binding protein